MNALAQRLYARMLFCPCDFHRACLQCVMDLDVIRKTGTFDYLAKLDTSFAHDAELIDLMREQLPRER